MWKDGKPYVGLPDHWYEFLNGPYAGNYKYLSPGVGYENSYDRLRYNTQEQVWEVYSDDDYHVDIFNQLILDEYDLPSSKAILESWTKYQVSDWGGGFKAMSLMNDKNLLPPFTGQPELGNIYAWCTEAYIENETLGMNAPGMPHLAYELVDIFSTTTGYFDSVTWAKYFGVLYSLAYFETDINELLKKAEGALPTNSWPRRIHDYALELYDRYPNDFRKAAIDMEKKFRNINGLDNIQTAPDINGGYTILSLLYGQGNYMETVRISSLIGYDETVQQQ